MIAKFYEEGNRCVSLEVYVDGSTEVVFNIDNEDDMEHQMISLKENDLFNLIGQLLRMQSEVRKANELSSKSIIKE